MVEIIKGKIKTLNTNFVCNIKFCTFKNKCYVFIIGDAKVIEIFEIQYTKNKKIITPYKKIDMTEEEYNYEHGSSLLIGQDRILLLRGD